MIPHGGMCQSGKQEVGLPLYRRGDPGNRQENRAERVKGLRKLLGQGNNRSSYSPQRRNEALFIYLGGIYFFFGAIVTHWIMGHFSIDKEYC